LIGAAVSLLLLKKEKAIKLQKASAKAGLAANGQPA